MFLNRWLFQRCDSVRRSPRVGQSARSHRRYRPLCEALEDRCLPTTVTTLQDGVNIGSLRDAIANTPANGIVTFQSGLSGTINLNLGLGSLNINKSLTISGPGASAITVSGQNQLRVFTLTGGPVTISGLTISNGNNVGLGGAGISDTGLVVYPYSLTIQNCTLSNNSGGALAVDGISAVSLSVQNCTFTSNSNGPALGVADFGTLSVQNCSFTNNSGGAMSIGRINTVTVANSTFTGNSVGGIGGNGGALFCSSGTVSVQSCTFSGNSATGPDGNGGAIYSTATLALQDSTLNGNTASGGGGGVCAGGGQLTLSIQRCSITNNQGNSGGGIWATTQEGVTVNASTISGNTAKSFGGGLYLAGITPTLTDCTIYNNRLTTPGGSGIFGGAGIFFNCVSPSTLVNCTITGNTDNSTFGGGGLCTGGTPLFGQSPVTLRNCIVAGNTTNSAGGQADIYGNIVTAVNNLIGNGTGTNVTNNTNGNQVGTAGTPLNPKLGVFQNNGGPTKTLALLAGSPAIDAGDNASVANPPFSGPPFTDQRGMARIVNGQVDIGAYEVQPPGTTTMVVTSGSPAQSGQSVQFTATVTDTATGFPIIQGNVSFLDNGAPLATVAVVNGTASFATTGLSAGSHTITARYNASTVGDSSFTGSSAALSQVITAPPPKPPPSLIGSGVISASIAFDHAGHQVTAVVYADGSLYVFDMAGAHFIGGFVHSVSIAFNPQGQEIVDVVFASNQLWSYDLNGAHFIGNSVLSVSISYNSQGQQVTAAAFSGGGLYVFDASGSHFVAPNVQAVSLGYDNLGRQVLDLVYSDTTLYQFDTSGAHFIGSGVQSVGLAFNQYAQQIIDVVFLSTQLWQY